MRVTQIDALVGRGSGTAERVRSAGKHLAEMGDANPESCRAAGGATHGSAALRRYTRYTDEKSLRLRLPVGLSGASPYQVCLPTHKPHTVWRDLDPTIQLLLLKQVKGRLSERHWLVLVREIQ